MNAIQIETFGNPAEVVRAVDVSDVGAPAPGEVVIALEASPVNQYDLMMIASNYGYRPQLPAIMAPKALAASQEATPDQITAMFDHLAPLIAAGTISVPVVATYGFGQFKEAIADAAKSRGKVLFTPKV